MRFLEGLLLCLSLALSLASARADVTTDAVIQQLKSCNRACISEGAKCLDMPGLNHAYCDTHEITCVSSCQACIKSFSNCMNVAENAMAFCQNVFNACLDEKLNAGRTREHIPIVFKGGDGLSFDTAVIIDGVLSDQETSLAENLWLSRNHPTWKKTGFSSVKMHSRFYDKIDYSAEDGKHTVWFDITSAADKVPQ